MRYTCLIASCLLLCGTTFGQVGTATLGRTVTDSSGAVIASAAVTLESTLQRFSRRTVTDSRGEYVIPAIPPGRYELRVHEFFNILNRTSFGYPGFIADSPQFGKQSSTFVSGRQIQVALKLHF